VTLRSSHAAACVFRSDLLGRLADAAAAGDRLLIWDPFCGQGTLLLEALGICLGVPPASPAMPLPFTNFPMFDSERFERTIQGLRVMPHHSIASLSLLGTETGSVDAAKGNMKAFVRTMPRHRNASRSYRGGHPWPDLPCDVAFHQVKEPADAWPLLAQTPTMILTQVPSFAKGEKKDNRRLARVYERFCRIVRELSDRGLLRGAYCLSHRDDFKRRAGLEWRSELRFKSSGASVDLLRWTGHTVHM